MKLRALTISVATAALLATAGAMAQDQPNGGAAKPGSTPAMPSAPTTPNAGPTTPQAPTNPGAAANKPAQDKAAQDTGAKTNNAGPIQFSSSVNDGDTLASDVIGMKVSNASGDNLGSINDLVLDKSGKSSVAVIGVGGFLGIGEKDVGVPFDKLQFAMDKNNTRVARLDLDKNALKSAPSFVYQDKQASARTPVKSY